MTNANGSVTPVTAIGRRGRRPPLERCESTAQEPERRASTRTSTNGGVNHRHGASVGPEPISLETTNGGVSLALPDRAKATVTASCTNGGISVGSLDNFEVPNRLGSLEGRLERRRTPIELHTHQRRRRRARSRDSTRRHRRGSRSKIARAPSRLTSRPKSPAAEAVDPVNEDKATRYHRLKRQASVVSMLDPAAARRPGRQPGGSVASRTPPGALAGGPGHPRLAAAVCHVVVFVVAPLAHQRSSAACRWASTAAFCSSVSTSCRKKSSAAGWRIRRSRSASAVVLGGGRGEAHLRVHSRCPPQSLVAARRRGISRC